MAPRNTSLETPLIVEVHEDRIQSLEAGQADLASRVTGLSVKLDNNSEAVHDAKDAVESSREYLSDKIDLVVNQVSALAMRNEQALDGLSASIQANTKDIKALESRENIRTENEKQNKSKTHLWKARFMLPLLLFMAGAIITFIGHRVLLFLGM